MLMVTLTTIAGQARGVELMQFVNPRLPPKQVLLCSDELPLRLFYVRHLLSGLLNGHHFTIVEGQDIPSSGLYLLYIGHPPEKSADVQCSAPPPGDFIAVVLSEAKKGRPEIDANLLPQVLRPMMVDVGGAILDVSSGNEARAQFCYLVDHTCGAETTLMAFNIDISICDAWKCDSLDPSKMFMGR